MIEKKIYKILTLSMWCRYIRKTNADRKKIDKLSDKDCKDYMHHMKNYRNIREFQLVSETSIKYLESIVDNDKINKTTFIQNIKMASWLFFSREN